MLLDAGRLQDGEPYLAGTARPPVARLSAATAAEIGAAEGDLGHRRAPSAGAITLPLEITDMPDRVVWLPLNSPGSAVTSTAGRDRGRRGRDRAGDSMTYPISTLVRPRPVVAGPGQGARRSSCSCCSPCWSRSWSSARCSAACRCASAPTGSGPWGLLQSLADGVKLGLKEGLIPAGVDKPIYLLAPIISVIPAFMAFAVIPMGR